MSSTDNLYAGTEAEASPTPTNPFRVALATKKHLIGPWVMTTDPFMVETIARTAVDFIVFDCQHGPHDLATLRPVLSAAAKHSKAALVRVPSSDPWVIMRALDLGASGVIVPMVSTAVEAEAARSATRYPPTGLRSYGPLQPAPGDTFKSADGPVVLIMIETTKGLENVEAIAGVTGIDGLFIGPVDLALGVGAMTEGDLQKGLMSPVLHEAIGTIATAAASTDVILAGAVFSPDHARTLAAAGMTVQVLGTDIGWLGAGASEVVDLADELR